MLSPPSGRIHLPKFLISMKMENIPVPFHRNKTENWEVPYIHNHSTKMTSTE
mgnify:CR=1 FL=1